MNGLVQEEAFYATDETDRSDHAEVHERRGRFCSHITI